MYFSYIAPPTRPEQFHTREELKKYLQKVLSFARILINLFYVGS
jgi:hypothetical protein